MEETRKTAQLSGKNDPAYKGRGKFVFQDSCLLIGGFTKEAFKLICNYSFLVASSQYSVCFLQRLASECERRISKDRTESTLLLMLF